MLAQIFLVFEFAVITEKLIFTIGYWKLRITGAHHQIELFCGERQTYVCKVMFELNLVTSFGMVNCSKLTEPVSNVW